MEQGKLPPPWVFILLGVVSLIWATEHYHKMVDFESGTNEQIVMYAFMSDLYDMAGFWPTVILPYVCAGAIALTGIALQVRDIRRRMNGDARPTDYEPVRWRGLLMALLVALCFIAVIFIVAFTKPD